MANIENLTKWVKALRSGEFKQGTGTLRTVKPHGEPAYCCLGVVCELMRREEPERFSWDEGGGSKCYFVEQGGEMERDFLSNAAVKWLGVDDRDPLFVMPSGHEQEHASDLNDNRDLSFYGIAKRIAATFNIELD